ncbi:type II secretion system F family protein [Acidisoma silvae]|uniref:Type II secretion system F family protein n=1 Tax=Acidisoma silvae TaxID=2802396 RepID=A0A964DZ53_9PROT|nr:type II secretion system F family protein [Acidisoma silvae]MCB8875896.1 type II secretion system F family protein [Acidisoma silvae]
MTPQLILIFGFILIVMAAVAAGILMISTRRQNQFNRRLRLVRGEWGQEKGQAEASGPNLVGLVSAFGRGIQRSGLLSPKTLKQFEEGLALAGLRQGNALGLFIGAKILLVIACPLLVIALTHEITLPRLVSHIAPFIAAIIGLLLPDKAVDSVRSAYRTKLELGVPDALDLMVICTQAGLGLVPTMQRVANEIGFAHPTVSREFSQTVSELQIAVNSATALTALGERTGLDSLKRVATTLIQSVQYGTPMGEALRALGIEMRQEALTRFEERAARLPVLLTLPMIVLILPCIFIVVAGPAALNLMKAFHH